MKHQDPVAVQMIPIECITVSNPRTRNRKLFNEIVASISAVGLKRPITVSKENDGTDSYELVCGQGRLEAYQALGQRQIPAIVIQAPREDCAVMGLVENLARRQHRALDLLHDIQGLKQRGNSENDIARKTGLSCEYVKSVIGLLENGEHRLLRAVESGHVPLSVAVKIAESSDTEIQDVLQQAYESKQLRGRKLLIAKRLIEQRNRKGKGLNTAYRKRPPSISSNALIRAYREDVDRKRVLIKKASATRDRLIFVTEALRKLLSDESFVNLLRAEGLDTLPKDLSQRIQAWEAA